MGDAKRKKLAGRAEPSTAARYNELRQIFDRLGVDCSRPGFYDDPRFLDEERRNPLFIETYAEWVLSRERTAEYDAMVRDVVPRLAALIEARVIRHNWNGACIAISGIVTKTLDRLGIWNIPMAGSASIYVGDNSRHFTIVDDNEGVGFDTGHMWIIAPPYDVVDTTLHYQRWQGDAFQSLIPKVILADRTDIVKARVQDVVAPDIRRRHPRDQDLHYKLFRDQRRILTMFPARSFVSGQADIRYVPAGIRVPDGPLEDINSEGRAGVPAIDIWREDIMREFNLTD
ncbi:hypothetical protein [Shinella kummerowiae]|uniref:hypothetical protein n=1 Tax=Shinella kummerowiae TaxID=417745 RepID=UPI0021B6D617|nr:hypothetical protein [Shinella kummerowiae]MCT7663540.1 hypothetical protein [Shinella kummerowiae]